MHRKIIAVWTVILLLSPKYKAGGVTFPDTIKRFDD